MNTNKPTKKEAQLIEELEEKAEFISLFSVRNNYRECIIILWVTCGIAHYCIFNNKTRLFGKRLISC